MFWSAHDAQVDNFLGPLTSRDRRGATPARVGLVLTRSGALRHGLGFHKLLDYCLNAHHMLPDNTSDRQS